MLIYDMIFYYCCYFKSRSANIQRKSTRSKRILHLFIYPNVSTKKKIDDRVFRVWWVYGEVHSCFFFGFGDQVKVEVYNEL